LKPLSLLISVLNWTDKYKTSKVGFQVKKKIRRFLKKGNKKLARRLENFRKARDGKLTVLGKAKSEYDVSQKISAIPAGGIGVFRNLARKLELATAIDSQLKLLKIYNPYTESDHVLNIALNVAAGGQTLQDIEIRRNCEAYLNALGAKTIPDPTTEGDFCRRFNVADIETLMDVFNQARTSVWSVQSKDFLKVANIQMDGIVVPTDGEKKAGMDISYKGTWGYHPLLVSLGNTQEPLFIVNRSGNRPSHEGAAEYADRAIAVCREGGFKCVRLSGDTDFALTKHFDRWTIDDVKFVFGIDARAALTELADFLPTSLYEELCRQCKYEVKTEPREKRENVKEKIVIDRGFRNLKLVGEAVAEFDYRPGACEKAYRIVVVRKDIHIYEGKNLLIPDKRYFFYITNDWGKEAEEIVFEANDRCNQENLGAQLLSGIYALKPRLDTLESNWAYMVIASLAWSMKAWLALQLPENGKRAAVRRDVLRMEFRRFLNEVIHIPCQIISTGRRIIYRILGYRASVSMLLELAGAT
jgi:hypothetical protein